MKLRISIIFIIFLASSIIHSQNFGKTKWDDKDWEKYLEFNWDEDSRPTIEFSYGLAKIKHKNKSGDFSKSGQAEFNLGYSSIDYYFKSSILEMHDKFFFGSFIFRDIKSKNVISNNINAEIWRFGFNSKAGFGYEIKEVSIFLYNMYGYVWSRVSTERPSDIAEMDSKILDRYEDSFRFGSQAEGGIQIVFSQFFSLNAAYEAAVIYPRHLFWKWAGSYIINRVADGALSTFVEEIMDVNPAAGPIVNFLLQNGLAYGFYALQRDNMNWPFSTESPLTFETIKFGMTFRF